MLGVFAEFERPIIQDKAEAHQLKETLAEVLIENRLLKKKRSRGWGGRGFRASSSRPWRWGIPWYGLVAG